MDFKTTRSLLLLLLGFCNAHQGNVRNNSLNIHIFSFILIGSKYFLLEGDVLIPRTRNAIKCVNKPYSCLWSKSANGNVEIPFILSEKYDNSERSKIFAALRDFASKTCIRFIPRAAQRAYVSIEPRYGCASLLGRIGDKQVVSLQRFGCIRHGIIQHELLHALGFYHEHTRSDRDMYVKINWENVNQCKKLTLRLTNSDRSVTAFGKFGAETITPIRDPSASVGQRDGLSKIDILRINRLYKCWRYVG
uniref:Metalloendopeptidase n=1 Tax=Seriola lalandi dorsalis TaxID=1841481 RepID=A0A3B4WF18_SERLL